MAKRESWYVKSWWERCFEESAFKFRRLNSWHPLIDDQQAHVDHGGHVQPEAGAAVLLAPDVGQGRQDELQPDAAVVDNDVNMN